MEVRSRSGSGVYLHVESSSLLQFNIIIYSTFCNTGLDWTDAIFANLCIVKRWWLLFE